MRKTVLTILGALLIAGSAVQMASASEYHARKAYRVPDAASQQLKFRGSYNQLNGPSYAAPLTSEEYRNQEDFGWSGRDPSRVGGMFPYFNGGSGS
jgi:hypothetical protein